MLTFPLKSQANAWGEGGVLGWGLHIPGLIKPKFSFYVCHFQFAISLRLKYIHTPYINRDMKR